MTVTSAFTDEERIADFVKRYEISDVKDFWEYVERDSEMSRIMKNDPNGDKLQYSSGRIAEMYMLKERRKESDRLARIQCVEHIQEYAYEYELFDYDSLLRHSTEYEPELASYIKSLDDVPLGRFAVDCAIRKAAVKRDNEARGMESFDWEEAGIPVDEYGNSVGCGDD